MRPEGRVAAGGHKALATPAASNQSQTNGLVAELGRRPADRKALVAARSSADWSASCEEIARPDGRAENKLGSAAELLQFRQRIAQFAFGLLGALGKAVCAERGCAFEA